MLPVLQLFLCLVGVSLASAIFFRMTKEKDWIVATLGVGMCTFAVLAIVGLAMIRQIGPNQMVLKQANNTWHIVAVFPHLTNVWRWDPRVAGTGFIEDSTRKLISYEARSVEHTIQVEPITPNPKVREIHYSVWVEVGGNPERMLEFLNLIGGLWEERWLKYYLYEFNERYGREIGTFYNPLDDAQQKRFNKLVQDFLAPYIEKAPMRFERAQFSL